KFYCWAPVNGESIFFMLLPDIPQNSYACRGRAPSLLRSCEARVLNSHSVRASQKTRLLPHLRGRCVANESAQLSFTPSFPAGARLSRFPAGVSVILLHIFCVEALSILLIS